MNFQQKQRIIKNKKKWTWLYILLVLYVWIAIVLLPRDETPRIHDISMVSSAFASEDSITYKGLLEKSSVQPPFTIYSKLKDECYAQNAIDKKHCIKTGLSVAYAESSWKDYQTPFWLQSRDKGYSKWVSSYVKYWYTSTNWHFFYGDYGELGRSHYCTSEESSGSSYGCPNGRKNFDATFNSLSF